MQVSVENTGGLERKLTVQIPGDEIQDKVNQKLRELSKQVRIKGFRPGRVPMSVVKQRYGKQTRQDIVNETIQASLQQAIAEEKLRPASMPRFDTPPEGVDGGDLEFSAVIEVYPEIGEVDMSALELEKPETQVSDDDVEEMLNTLREQRKTWDEVERAAQEGDQVAFEFSAETKEGRVPKEGDTRMSIVIGSSGFEELDKAIASMVAGDEKSVKLTFPENFREAALGGKKAKTELKVVKVAEPNVPEVDEDFIKSFGVESGELDALKVEIRQNLERELKQAVGSVLKTRLVDELIKAMPDLEVPAGVVKDEARSMAAQLFAGQGEQPDREVVEKLSASFMEQAERRVRAGLLMGEVAQQNGIRINPGKVREAIETVANTYEQPEEVVQLYYNNQQLLQQVESSVLEEQVVDWALENAKVTPKKMKFQEVINAASQSGGAYK
jgi:trigger factor